MSVMLRKERCLLLYKNCRELIESTPLAKTCLKMVTPSPTPRAFVRIFVVSKEDIVLVETVDAAVMLWFRMEVESSWEDTAFRCTEAQ